MKIKTHYYRFMYAMTKNRRVYCGLLDATNIRSDGDDDENDKTTGNRLSIYPLPETWSFAREMDFGSPRSGVWTENTSIGVTWYNFCIDIQ